MPDLFQKPSPTPAPSPSTDGPTPVENAQPEAAAPTQNEQPTAAQPVQTPAVHTAAGLQAQPFHHFRFSSFYRSMFEKPDGVSFINQEADESVILLLHASFFSNAPWILLTIFLILLPPVILLFFPASDITLPQLFSPAALSIVFFSYYLMVFGYAYINYIGWFYNVSIVSNLHVLDIEFSNMSYKKVDTVTIRDIADVSYTQAGFFRTLFDFGTVRIDPQAQNNSIYFENVPKPSYVTDLILDLKEGNG